MWMYGNAWWMWLLMAVATVGFWVLVAVTVKAVLDDRRQGTPVEPSPTQVLDGRLARGEIDADEYLRLRHLIQQAHRTDHGRRPARPPAP